MDVGYGSKYKQYCCMGNNDLGQVVCGIDGKFRGLCNEISRGRGRLTYNRVKQPGADIAKYFLIFASLLPKLLFKDNTNNK